MPTALPLNEAHADNDPAHTQHHNDLAHYVNGAVQASLVDAKGDLIAATGADTLARFPVGADGLIVVADSTQAAGLAWAVDNLRAMYLTSGEEVRPRSLIAGTETDVSAGYVHLSYWMARKTETINNLQTHSGSVASSGLTLAKMGVYSVAGNGDLTKVTECASDTGLWGSTFTSYTRATTGAWAKVAGQRYAFAVIATGTTMPRVGGVTISSISASAPRELGAVTGQTDLPASISSASVSSDYRLFQGYVIP